MSDQRPPIHLTLKWSAPGRDYPAMPEIMANLYGENAAEVAANLGELRALIGEQFPLLGAEAAQIMNEVAQPAPQQEKRPFKPVPSVQDTADYEDRKPVGTFVPDPEAEPEPWCRSDSCQRHGKPLLPSRWDGLYCPGEDWNEANRRCRWVADNRGWRRKPTKAEMDAQGAATGTGARDYAANGAYR